MRLRPLLALLFGLFLASVATAAGTSTTVSWTAPTMYNDGTLLPAADIASYTLSWSRTVGGPILGSKLVTTTSTTVPVPCGTYQFSVTVTTTASASVPSSTSDPDGPVSYASGVTCKPNPPTGLQAS